jgi:hypothetical protein
MQILYSVSVEAVVRSAEEFEKDSRNRHRLVVRRGGVARRVARRPGAQVTSTVSGCSGTRSTSLVHEVQADFGQSKCVAHFRAHLVASSSARSLLVRLTGASACTSTSAAGRRKQSSLQRLLSSLTAAGLCQPCSRPSRADTGRQSPYPPHPSRLERRKSTRFSNLSTPLTGACRCWWSAARIQDRKRPASRVARPTGWLGSPMSYSLRPGLRSMP